MDFPRAAHRSYPLAVWFHLSAWEKGWRWIAAPYVRIEPARPAL